MKEICTYILAFLIAMNSYGCATQPLVTESAMPTPFENTMTTQVNDEGEVKSDETVVDTVISLLLIGALVVLGVGFLTCCDISFASN